MDLELESGRIIHGVHEKDLPQLLVGEEYAVLSINPYTFIQCSACHVPPFVYTIEYQDGSLDSYYRATNQEISENDVAVIFQKYLRGDTSWLTNMEWEKVDRSAAEFSLSESL